ncbi:MAG: Hsp20/alpha crystallin family protein [Pseudomonadota bacterium]|nr:Hsp20/alpha crystallin family protein [Pseudomonadota bacterium]
MSSRDPTAWMWSQACEMIEQAERMHRQFFRLMSSERSQAAWEPPVDVFEDEHEITIVIALPGVAPGEVEVNVEAGVLVVRAERRPCFGGALTAVRQLEIPYGHFERRIAFPGARLDGATQELVNGCLILRLRKAGRMEHP